MTAVQVVTLFCSSVWFICRRQTIDGIRSNMDEGACLAHFEKTHSLLYSAACGPVVLYYPFRVSGMAAVGCSTHPARGIVRLSSRYMRGFSFLDNPCSKRRVRFFLVLHRFGCTSLSTQ